MKISKEVFGYFCVLVVLWVAIAISWLVSSYNEAASFRKITGRTDVTMWDAMWLELRIVDKARLM